MARCLSDFVITGVSSVVAPPLRDLHGSPGEGIAPMTWFGRPARLARMDRLCALALVAADGALIDAGVPPNTIAGGRTAVIVGTAFGCHATNEAYYRPLLQEGLKAASPRLFAYTLPSSPLGEICIHYQITGPASTRAGMLTAGLEALIEGQQLLGRQSIDRVLVVAADVGTQWLMRILGRTDLEDSAAGLVLERRQAALERGRESSARLVGCGAAFSAGCLANGAAAQKSFAMAARTPAEVTRVYAPPDCTSELGAIARAPHGYRAGLLATAPLYHLAQFLRNEVGLALFEATDPQGATAAVLIERAAAAPSLHSE